MPDNLVNRDIILNCAAKGSYRSRDNQNKIPEFRDLFLIATRKVCTQNCAVPFSLRQSVFRCAESCTKLASAKPWSERLCLFASKPTRRCRDFLVFRRTFHLERTREHSLSVSFALSGAAIGSLHPQLAFPGNVKLK